MKKFDIHTYVNISSIITSLKEKAYKITLTCTYKYKLFGKIIEKEKVEEIPFYFKTLDIAKDYCMILPRYEKCTKKNVLFHDIACIDISKYETYKVILDDNRELYIKWNHTNQHIIKGMISKKESFTMDNVVDGFSTEVEVYRFYPDYSDGCVFENIRENLTNAIQELDKKRKQHITNKRPTYSSGESYDFELFSDKKNISNIVEYEETSYGGFCD